jgi:anaerobic ribonucleoside-triphosphate reductase activating protein
MHKNWGNRADYELIEQTDVLVAGPFLRAKIDRLRPWLGSTNQEFHFLTDFYQPADFEAKDGLEIEVRTDGSILVNGWAEQETISSLLPQI